MAANASTADNRIACCNSRPHFTHKEQTMDPRDHPRHRGQPDDLPGRDDEGPDAPRPMRTGQRHRNDYVGRQDYSGGFARHERSPHRDGHDDSAADRAFAGAAAHGQSRWEGGAHRDFGGARQPGGGRSRWDESYDEYESHDLTRDMGGGTPLFEQNRGGGHYTHGGRGGGGDDYGSSYERPSQGAGRAPHDDQPRHDRSGADYGGGGYGGNYSGQPRRSSPDLRAGGRHDDSERIARNYRPHGSRPPVHVSHARPEAADYGGGHGSVDGRSTGRPPGGGGSGAFGSGYPGEHASMDPARDDWRHITGGDAPQRDHRGRGPRGYARSDQRMQEDICERITDDPHVDASDIDIKVEDGVVTLSGSIESRWMKYYLEDLVDRCPGVKDIRNELSTRRAGREQAGETPPGSPEKARSGPVLDDDQRSRKRH
jgi:hypothetical protein